MTLETPAESNPCFEEEPNQATLREMDRSSIQWFLQPDQVDSAQAANDFTKSVGVQAAKIAKRRQASAVDSPDITKAIDTVYPQTPNGGPLIWAILGLVGGVLLSIAICLFNADVTTLASKCPPQPWSSS